MNALVTIPTQPYALTSPVPMNWANDLRDHTLLIEERETIITAQASIIERLRLTRPGKADKTDEFADPAIIRLEMSLTQNIEVLDDRIEDLDKELRTLEARILTCVPESKADAGKLLAFVSKLLDLGVELDPSYLSDLLGECSQVAA